MRVEWVGGPMDGHQMDVPDTFEGLIFALPSPVIWRNECSPTPEEALPHTRWKVPIKNGRVIWALREQMK